MQPPSPASERVERGTGGAGGGERLDQGHEVGGAEEGEATVAVVVRQRPERLGAQGHSGVQAPAGVEVEGRRGGVLSGVGTGMIYVVVLELMSKWFPDR